MHNASRTLSRSVSSFPFPFDPPLGSLRCVIVLGFETRIAACRTNTCDDVDDDDVGKKQKEARVDTINLCRNCIDTRCRFADVSAVYRMTENSRSNNRIVVRGGSYQLYENNEVARRGGSRIAAKEFVPPFQIERRGSRTGYSRGARRYPRRY